MSRRIPRLTGARPTNEQTRLMNFTPYLADLAGRGSIDFIQECLWLIAPTSPLLFLHQVTCQFATGQTLFGPLSVSLEPSLCGLVGRNGVGKTRLLRLLAGLDSLPAAILSAPPPLPG